MNQALAHIGKGLDFAALKGSPVYPEDLRIKGSRCAGFVAQLTDRQRWL